MKNLYKATEIFKCVHDSHKGYKNKISVYHILKEKSCYPDGCIYFRWRCKVLNKKSKCPRGYSHVGRKCFGCRDYYEEKIHNYPELQVTPEHYKQFLRELDEFEDWIDEYNFKPISFWGRVKSVKPNFVQKIFQKSKYLSFRGFVIVLKDAYLDRSQFEDPIYAVISNRYYEKLNFGVDGEIEGIGNIYVDHGRLVLRKLKHIEVINAGRSPLWNKQKAELSREMAVELNSQPENCMKCPYGSLVEQKFAESVTSAPNRKLFCLKGLAEYQNCYVPVTFCSNKLENYI